jgi:hypothetical protein
MSADDEVDRQIEEIERAEREQRAFWSAARDAVRTGPLADRFAGTWRRDGTLHIAIAAGDGPITLPEVLGPGITIWLVRYSAAELHALCSQVEALCDAEGLERTYVTHRVEENDVEACVPDLADPAVERVQARLTGRPVVWTEGTVYAVGA